MKKKSSPSSHQKSARNKPAGKKTARKTSIDVIRNIEASIEVGSRESQMKQRFAEDFRGVTLSDSDIEKSLLIGNHSEAIEQMVGKDYAEKLRQLASEANQMRVAGNPRVLILPGILGSTLAVGDDTVWLDVLDIMNGRLRELSLDGGASNVQSNGVFWPTYMELKLKLRSQGFQAEYFHYDWRKPIAEAGK